MKAINIISILSVSVLLIFAGCAKPVIIPPELLAQETECMAQVAKVQISTNAANYRQTRREFKDERNAVLVIAIEALAKSNAQVALSPFIPCTQTVQAYLRENGAVMRSNNDITQKAIGVVGIVGGIWAAGNAIEGIMSNVGSSTEISGSRVVQNSDNYGNGSISSSGAGLGQDNTFGGTTAVGGQSRSQSDLDNVSGSASNSGEFSIQKVSTGEGEANPVVEPVAIQPVP